MDRLLETLQNTEKTPLETDLSSWMRQDTQTFQSREPSRILRRQGFLQNGILGYDHTMPQAFLVGRAVIWAGLVLWGIKMITGPLESAGDTFLHNINLPIHETGHLVFMPFGQFMHFLGGTLGQILMPLILTAAFLFKKRDGFAAAVCFWWVGQNFLDIAPYINDARAQSLPLVGGGVHDWGWLLGRMRILNLDHTIARTSFTIGAVIMIAAVIWAAAVLWIQVGDKKKKRTADGLEMSAIPE